MHHFGEPWGLFGSAIRTEWDNRQDAPHRSLESVASTPVASKPHHTHPPTSLAPLCISYHHIALEEGRIESLTHDKFICSRSLLAHIVLGALVRQVHSLANRVEEKTVMLPKNTSIGCNHLPRS